MTTKCQCGRDFELTPNGRCYICECEAYALRVGVLREPSQVGPNRTRISQPAAWKPRASEAEVNHGR